MKQRKLSTGQQRSALIASYPYGTAFTAWGDPREVYADVSKEEREDSKTMEDGSYPIKDCTGEGPTVESAVKAVGRGKADHDKIRKHIIEAATDLKCSDDLIPDNWNSDGTVDESKTSAKLAAPPPPVPKADAPEKAPKPDGDASVSSALADAKAAISKAVESVESEPDAQTDPNDKKVMDELKALQTQLAAVEKAQATDDEGDAKADKAPPVTAADSPGTAEKPESPVADNGDVDNEQPCARPSCGHLASAHEDTSEGLNRGKCTMQGCHCEAMQVTQEQDESETETADDMEGPSGSEDEDSKLAAVDSLAEPAPDTDLNPPPPAEGSDAVGPAFSAVIIIEGQPTGDGREIAVEALTWRTPPIPLMGLKTETHDPMGFDMNDPAVICGRIDSITREPGEGSTAKLIAKGYFLANDDGMYFAELCEQMGRIGISADVAVQEVDMQVGDVDEYGFPTEMSETLTQGTLMGGTICPFPAFESCYAVLGDLSDAPEPIEQKSDAMSEPAEAVTASVHFMTYEECEACDQGYEVITASAGPTRPPGAWFSDPGFTEGDGRLMEILGREGRREDKYACPITVTPEGRVFGHLAAWGTCHTGKPGRCITAPHSAANYAHFLRGQHITTAEGEKVRVGAITADTGHANLQFSAVAAMAHYDDTATVLADVAVGEDDYGIWVAGAVRPDATEAQINKLTASSLSGDWREVGGQLELVGALCVPLPGFPLAVVEEAFVAHGQLETVTAAGANVMARLKSPPESDPVDLLKLATPALGRLVREDARKRIASLA